MLEGVNKLMLAGLGAFAMTRDRAEALFEDYVKRGQAERTGRAGFVDDLMNQADETRHKVEEMIARQVRHAISGLNLATREDIERLEAKLDQAVKTAK